MEVLGIIQKCMGRQLTLQRFINQTVNTAALLLGTTTLLSAQLVVAEPVSSIDMDTPAIQPLLAQAGVSDSSQLANGIYLFGEKPLPEQLQTAYMVFEARAGEVVGAFYAPHSSFDCFQGDIQSSQLSLAVTETYSQEVYPYMLPLEDTVIAGPVDSEIAIEGFHQIDTVSDNDMRMLSTCQAHYNQTI